MNQPPSGGYPGQPSNGGPGGGDFPQNRSESGGGQPYSNDPYSSGPGAGGPQNGSSSFGPEGTRQFPSNPYGPQQGAPQPGGYSYGGPPYGQPGDPQQQSGPHYGQPYGQQQPGQQFGGQNPYGQFGGPQQPGGQFAGQNPYGQFGGPQQPGGPGASSNKSVWWIVGGVIALIVVALIAVAGFFALRPTGEDGEALPATSEPAATSEPNSGGSDTMSETFESSATMPSATTEASTSSRAVPPPADGSEGAVNIRLEASSEDGSEVTVTYLDADTEVQQEDVPSPWSTEFELEGQFVVASLGIFSTDDTEVTCKIFVDGQEVDSKTASGAFSAATCEYIG